MNGYQDPKAGALAYLQEKEVPKLFEELMAGLIFAMPDDPIPFMIDFLQKKKVPGPAFFSDSDLKTMFGIFDKTHTGFISGAQFKQALKDVGVTKDIEPVSDKIDVETFVIEVRKALE